MAVEINLFSASSGISADSGPGVDFLLRRKKREYLAIAGGQDHPLRFNSPDFNRFQVGDYGNLPALELLGGVVFFYSGDQGALLVAEVYCEPVKLVGSGDFVGGDDFRDFRSVGRLPLGPDRDYRESRVSRIR